MSGFNGLFIFFIYVLQGCSGTSFQYIFSKPGPGGKGGDNPRIVNGTKVQRRDRYPAQALLYYRDWYRCGGTIVDSRHVLTAAHCVINDPSQRYGYFIIAVGKFKMKKDSGSEQRRVVSSVIIHRDYSRGSYAHDLALLRLDKELNFNRKVQPATLSTPEFDQTVGRLKSCYATGFGVIDDKSQKIANALQELKTNVLSRNKCINTADSLYGLGSLIYKETVCTLDVNSGVCQGDSGGPLGCFDETGTFHQVGVLSWGSNICAEGFNVFIRVSKYLKWIENITNRSK